MSDAATHWICPFFRGERSPHHARVWVLNPGSVDATVTVSWHRHYENYQFATRTVTIPPGLTGHFTSDEVYQPPPPGIFVLIWYIEQGWVRIMSDQAVLPTGVTAVPWGITFQVEPSHEHVVPMTFYRG